MALDTRIHLLQTQKFVSERPVDIVVQRRRRQSDGKGGFKWVTGSSLPPQTVRKVGIGRLSATTERTTADGKVVVPNATIIALPQIDLQRYDKFEIDGIMHEVVAVSRLPEWRVSADVYEES